ncbi:hypothetical protein [Azospira sp. I13]|nr:hypothetical protein [Azospira sp. I13]
MHDSEAVLNGKDPLAEARKPLKPIKEVVPLALPSGLDDDLPDFTAGEGV